MSDVKQNCPACRGAGVFVKTVMVDFGHGEQVEDRCNRCLGTGVIYAPLPASTAASEQQAGADGRAMKVIHELSSSSMRLAADLVRMEVHTFYQNEYLPRDYVMQRVMRWRAEWDSTATERAALTHRATTAPDLDEAKLMRLVREFAEIVYGVRCSTEDAGKNLIDYVKSLAAAPAVATTAADQQGDWPQMVRDLVQLWDGPTMPADDYSNAMCTIEDRMRKFAAMAAPATSGGGNG